MDGIIKVAPEQLRTTAGEFNSQGQQVSTITGEMMNLVTGLTAVWEGEAAQTYITKFRGLEDDIQKMCRMITEHVNDLNDMAERYSTAEIQANDLANNLSSDVIV